MLIFLPKASGTAELSFEDVKVPAENLVGQYVINDILLFVSCLYVYLSVATEPAAFVGKAVLYCV